jgi:hypothetical protein
MSIWDIVQQVQIENLKARQQSGVSDAERAESRSRSRDADLEDRLGRLVLLTEAMWELLSERFGLTTADLAARVREIDARDGRVDGRRGVPSDAAQVRCASCQAVVPFGRDTCQFCGAAVPGAKADPFRP